MDSATIRIIAIDDHQIVLDGLARILDLKDSYECSGLFINGTEALRYMQFHPVDIVILDIEMPEENGIQICKKIKEKYTDTKVIALSMLNQYNVILEMIKAGIDGYLVKNCDYNEFMTCIDEVFKGNQFFSPEIEKIINHKKNQKVNAQRFPLLSSREKDVVHLILKELTVKQIAELLFISTNTVDSHRKNIMKKLDVRNVAGLVKVVLENRLLN